MAATAVPNQIVNVRGYRYEVAPNENAEKSALDQVIDFEGKSFAIYRSAKILEGVTKLAVLHLKQVGSCSAQFGQELAGRFTNLANGLSIFRLPEVTRNAYRAVADWSVRPQGPTERTYRDQFQRIHDAAEGFATWGFALAFVTGKAWFADAVSGPDLVSNITDVVMGRQDRNLAARNLAEVERKHPDNAPVQQMFKDKMMHAALQTAKAVCSVLSGVLGLMVLAFGGPILPPLPLICLGLTGTVSAVAAHFYKETSAYKLPDFPKISRAEVLRAG